MNEFNRYLDWELQPETNSIILKIGVPILSVLTTFAFRLVLDPILQQHSSYILFTIPVAISSLYAGPRSGVLATLLSALISNSLFLNTPYNNQYDRIADIVALTVFLSVGFIISFLGGLVRRLNRRVSHILESITDAFFIFNRQQQLIYANTHALKILISPVKTRTLKSGQKLYSADLANSEMYKKVFRSLSKLKATRFETFIEHKKQWFEVHTYPTRDGTAFYFQNITERKSSEQLKDDFISIASHELKTPLTSLKVYTQIVHYKLMGKSDAEILRYIKQIEVQTDKLTKLVNQLLDVSRIQAKKVNYNFQKTDLTVLVEETIAVYQQTIKSHKIVLQGKVTGWTMVDQDRITQVLINLLSNAVKYSPNAKQVVVTLASTQTSCFITVQDFGIGIPKDHLNRVFGRFYRIEEHQHTFPGMGVGLFITAEIVRGHHGRIWVESEVDKGSRFLVEIPRQA